PAHADCRDVAALALAAPRSLFDRRLERVRAELHPGFPAAAGFADRVDRQQNPRGRVAKPTADAAVFRKTQRSCASTRGCRRPGVPASLWRSRVALPPMTQTTIDPANVLSLGSRSIDRPLRSVLFLAAFILIWLTATPFPDLADPRVLEPIGD